MPDALIVRLLPSPASPTAPIAYLARASFAAPIAGFPLAEGANTDNYEPMDVGFCTLAHESLAEGAKSDSRGGLDVGFCTLGERRR